MRLFYANNNFNFRVICFEFALVIRKQWIKRRFETGEWATIKRFGAFVLFLWGRLRRGPAESLSGLIG